MGSLAGWGTISTWCGPCWQFATRAAWNSRTAAVCSWSRSSLAGPDRCRTRAAALDDRPRGSPRGSVGLDLLRRPGESRRTTAPSVSRSVTRGMGLDWDATRQLIQRSATEAAAAGGRIVVGVGTDHAAPTLPTLAGVIAAYQEQLEFVEGTARGWCCWRAGSSPRALTARMTITRSTPGCWARSAGRSSCTARLRPGAGRLLGIHRPPAGRGNRAGARDRIPARCGRDQDVTAGQRAGGGAPPKAAAWGAHVYR